MKIQPTVQKPQSVKNATNLLLISLVIKLVLVIYNFQNDNLSPNTTEYVTAIITIFLMLAVYIFLILKINSGRNWVRITYLILFILVTPINVLILPSLYLISPVDWSVYILDTGIVVVVILELFSKTANEWFNSIKFASNPDLDASYNYKESDSILASQEIDDFTKITELYKQGLLTDEEYKKQKQKYGIEIQQNNEILLHKRDGINFLKNIFVGIGVVCLMYIYVLNSPTYNISTLLPNFINKIIDNEFYATSPEPLFESNPKGANILTATGQYKMIECPDEECYANFLVDGRRKYIEVVQEEHYDLAEANLNAYFKITAEKSYQEGYYVLKKLEKITR